MLFENRIICNRKIGKQNVPFTESFDLTVERINVTLSVEFLLVQSNQ